MIKFCPNCGKEVSSKFCPYCGYDMSTVVFEDPVVETPAEDVPAEDVPEISFEPADSAPAEEPAPEFNFDFGTDTQTTAEQKSNTYTAPEQEPASNNVNYNTYYIPPEQQKESVTTKTWFIILFLFLFWPLGLFFMWRAKKFSKAARIIITAVIGVLFILNIIGTVFIFNAADDYDDYDDYDYSYDSDYLDDSDDYSSSYNGSGTLIDGRTAYEAAKSYLNALNFSREGLIDQLEYEGYSNSDATAAVDSLIVDWNKQAAGSAANYLDVFPDMTRSEMIDQLEYEGYTYSQAAYGADAVGL